MDFFSTVKGALLKTPFKDFFLNKNTQFINFLSAQPIFSGLKAKQLKLLEKYVLVESVSQSQDIEHLNLKIENNLCCVLEGSLKVKRPDKKEDFSECQAGEVVDLASFVAGVQRSKVAEIVEPATLLIVQIEHLKQLADYKKNIEPILLRNAMRLFLLHLSHVEEVLKNTSKIATHSIEGQLAEIKTRMLFGIFIIRVLIVLCLYTLILKILETIGLKLVNTSPISILVLSIMVGVMYRIMLKTRLPMSNFGLTIMNWKVAIKESLLFSFIFLGIITLIKFIKIHYSPVHHNLPLFDWNVGVENFKITDLETFIFLILYGVFAPIQEFLVRGGLQGSLNEFLYGTKNMKLWTSIFVSNLLFITFHLHTSITFSALTFLPGLFWGWLYARHKTLVGVSISHVLVGIYVLFILGISKVLPGTI